MVAGGEMWSFRDKVDMAVAWVGFTLIMAILIGAGIVGHLATPSDDFISTLGPENMTTEDFTDTTTPIIVELLNDRMDEPQLEKLPTDRTDESKLEKLPADRTDESQLEKLPADRTDESQLEKLPADRTDEPQLEKLPTDRTYEPQLEELLLPKTLKAVHYLVRLQPFLNGNLSIKGYVEVELEVLERTSNITLNMADIITHNDTITVRQNGDLVAIRQHVYDARNQWYVAQLHQELLVNQMVVITMGFTGFLSDHMRGFIRASYLDTEGNTEVLAVSQFFPAGARRAFPCLDQPSQRAMFTVSLAREGHMTALSNMPIYATAPLPDQPGWVWDHFNTTLPTPTYALAFILCDFIKNSTIYGDVEFSVWTRSKALQQVTLALETGPKALAFLESYLDVPFPLAKLDLVATAGLPSRPTANWGVAVISEAEMLYDPRSSTTANKQVVRSLVVREVFHQWFAALTTLSRWNDFWLVEALGSYMEYVATQHMEPEWKMMEQMVVETTQDAFVLDSLGSSRPLTAPVNDPQDTDRIFDAIPYKKGASVMRMLNSILSETTFEKGLTRYLDRFYSSNEAVTQDDLWQSLTEAASEDDSLASNVTVKTVMETWTLQPGYPVITVTRSDQGTTATVSQERFLLVGRGKTVNKGQGEQCRWRIPLSYTTAQDPDFSHTEPSHWLQETQQEMTLSSLPAKDKWVIFNLQEMGYYRVNYDDSNWALLMEQLSANHTLISVTNRAQIVDDSFNLARAGRLSYKKALGVTAYLSQETEYIPWKAALNNLAYLDKMLTRTPGYGALKKYMLSLLASLYEYVGFEDVLEDPHLEQLLRVLGLPWACRLGLQDCVENAVKQFDQWTTTGSVISANLKSTVQCTGVAAGGEDEWNSVWNSYLLSDLPSEKTELLLALACSNKPWIISRYMDMAFTEGSGISKEDSTLVFEAVAGNEIGHTVAWAFLRDQWSRISSYHNTTSSLSDLITSVAAEFNTEVQKHELEMLYQEESHTMGYARLAVLQALETTENNIAWMETNYQTIVEWLNDHEYNTDMARTKTDPSRGHLG